MKEPSRPIIQVIQDEHNLTDYEATYASFSIDVPEYYNFGFDVIDKWVRISFPKTVSGKIKRHELREQGMKKFLENNQTSPILEK